ncbi:Plant intracellular Ras-group-related LRR protein 8 [Portunus trituberculatus]|uniref:Plant intracellular Ras-group-related LRR protein 8 n=1 Tax=Portunus trituberculatus TaxID=210409 RepID=A0A5B7ELK4_PORTR|nr:Plant intracellular Ras-group-related LRR protein 8 [Portunus trituberculatus]
MTAECAAVMPNWYQQQTKKMGNSSVKEAAEEAKGNRSLNLSFKLTPKQYVKIPEELSLHVPHLKFLNLSHNQITSLPHSFSLLLHLRVLDLSYNRFRVVPEALTGLEKLHTLNLANNNITELPVALAKLTSLEKLNISNNCLRALPGSLVECPKLHVLVTQGNELIHPPQAICDTGSQATLHFLRERHLPTQQTRPTAKVSIFTRVRGVQVMASVSNPESASMEYRQAQGMSRTNKLKCPLMPPACATSLTPDQLTDSLLGLLYGVAISDAMALNTEGLTVDECNFFYDSQNFSLENRISDYLRTHFPPHDWSSNTDIMLYDIFKVQYEQMDGHIEGQKTKGAPVTGLAKELMQKVEETLTDKSEKERFLAAFHNQHEKCDVLTTLQMLMFALNSEQLDFKEHITRIVMQGGDGVCVHASVVGGVLGLIHGYANLPQDWLIQLPKENFHSSKCQ